MTDAAAAPAAPPFLATPDGTPAQPPTAAQAARLQALGDAVRAGVAAHDFGAALQAAGMALQMVPGHPLVLADLALCLMRLGRVEEALPPYEAAAQAMPDDENIADGLAECYGRAGRRDDAAREGCRALALKAAQVAAIAGWPLPAAQPVPFDAARAQRNVVAFSLFGDNPRYCETAVLNVAQVRRWLPGWCCRFYVDARVPQHVLQRLGAGGAQIVDMSDHAAKDLNPLTWRFLVLDDDSVDRFLLRDADALVSAREAGAVDHWLRSSRWFHLMRDTYTHSELLLAGMWGGCGGVFRDVAASLREFAQRPPKLSARLMDQHWLREHAWPTVRQSVLAHDSAFAFAGAQPFPPHEAVVDLGRDFHVGGDICAGSVGGPSAACDGASVHWRLVDDQGSELCRYASLVRTGAWTAHLPRPYMAALQAQRWRCQVSE